ncbi:MAG: transporter substrate-binding domain-containing protein [Pseudomonadota bacterium]
MKAAIRVLAMMAAALTLALMTSSSGALAQERAVKVSLRVLPPMVETQPDGKFSGFSAELWQAISDRLHWQSTYQVAPDVHAQLDAVASGAADVGVGAISITAERNKEFDFSQPILNAGLQIMVRSERAGAETTALDSLLHLLFAPAVLVWLSIAVLLTIIPAHIVWFVERNQPDGMISSKKYFPGIFQAFFWGLGALATQADSMPKHWFTRIVAVLWMFTSVVFVAFYTAQLTASLTVQQFRSEISGPSDLPGKRVATIRASTSAEYLHTIGVQPTTFATAQEAVAALENNTVDAVVFDAPVLQYYAAHDGAGKVRVVGSIFRNEDYGFAFVNGSPLRKEVDGALLSLREDGSYERLQEKYFGGD